MRGNIKKETIKNEVIFKFCCCFLYVVLCVPNCSGRPTTLFGAKTSVSLTIDYLAKYGYVRHSELGAGNLMTEAGLGVAIRRMQKFGNIPETGVVDAATVQLMRSRRCGVADLIGRTGRAKRFTLQGQRWPSTNLSWSVKDLVQNSEALMVRGQLRRAFGVWSDASDLTFTEMTDNSTRADIVVSFLHGSHGDGYPFDGEGSVLAHAFFPGEGIGGDAHFDAEERWLARQPRHEEEGVNLFAVAAHEIGHSVGLSHSSMPGSLMFPYYQIVDGKFRLPQDDVNGIQKLYGSKSTEQWAKLFHTSTTVSSLTTSTRPPEATTFIPLTSSAAPRTPTKQTQSKVKNIQTTSNPQELTTVEHPEISSTTATTIVEQTTIKSTTTDYPDWGDPPDTCNTTIDAISVIRREVFLFKGKFFWRLDLNKKLKRGYPAPIDRFWYKLPPDIERIDALYERIVDTKIMFFSGHQYWLFSANQPIAGYPRPLTALGLPPYIDHIDAAMVWSYNGKAYFFSGRQYWRYDELDDSVELDYPRDISAWRGVPHDLDAAFQWTDGNTYFFKGRNFWKFNDFQMKTFGQVGDLNSFWFSCPNTQQIENSTTTAEPPLPQENAAIKERQVLSYCLIITVSMFIWSFHL